MNHLPNLALELFEMQHGVASRAQLLETGTSPHGLIVLQRSGLLEEVFRGVYRLHGQPLTELGRCAAVCLAHPSAIVSGPTAARLWGFRGVPRDLRIHVINSPASHPTIIQWVVPYRTAAIREQDRLARADGIVVTSRARTALDLARWVRGDALLSVIEQAIHDGALDPVEMWDVASPWISPQRPWLSAYLDRLAHRLDGPAAESHPEVVVGERLRRAGVAGLVRQYVVDLPGYGRARFDLSVPDRKWAIEVDAFPTHRETAGRRRDQRRIKRRLRQDGGPTGSAPTSSATASIPPSSIWWRGIDGHQRRDARR